MSAVEVVALSKKYGRIRAVDNLNLEIPRGVVFGLLGPNGSGKTTTLGMLLGVVQPTMGSFSWFDGMNPKDARKRIGAILEQPVFYPHLSGIQNLKIAAQIKGCGTDKISEVLSFVSLNERGKDKFSSYSLGMKQRLAIASALIADPDVLILDEPTNGLDPQGIHDIRDLITQIAENGKTIILASHLLDEVQKVCSEYAVLQKGQCIHQGNVNIDLAGNGGWKLISDNLEELHSSLSDIPFIEAIERSKDEVTIRVSGEISGTTINKTLMEKGVILSQLSEHHNTLEEKFLEILKGQS